MNKFRFSKYVKILTFICALLALASCDRVVIEYIVLERVVTATPAGGNSVVPPIITTPMPPVDIEPLKVIWITTPKCTGGKLKGATVELRISGGLPPYTTSPKSPFPISPENNVQITVTDQDGNSFTATIPPPSCDSKSEKNPDEGEESSEGTGSTPGGGTGTTPTVNPTHHP